MKISDFTETTDSEFSLHNHTHLASKAYSMMRPRQSHISASGRYPPHTGASHFA